MMSIAAGPTADPAAWGEILAGLRAVPLSRIVAATGLSKSYAGQVRRG
jgi:hypothetical protein